jgi:hypothetical protein
MAEDNYIPFGEEWEKEIIKMPKKFIVKLYRTAIMKQQKSRDTLQQIAQFSYTGSAESTLADIKAIATKSI